jgi:hypothetical protein
VAVAYRGAGHDAAGQGSGLLPFLVCPQLTLNQNAGCQSPLNPIIRTILATTGGLLPWSALAGLMLVAAGLGAFRRRTRAEARQQAAH